MKGNDGFIVASDSELCLTGKKLYAEIADIRTIEKFDKTKIYAAESGVFSCELRGISKISHRRKQSKSRQNCGERHRQSGLSYGKLVGSSLRRAVSRRKSHEINRRKQTKQRGGKAEDVARNKKVSRHTKIKQAGGQKGQTNARRNCNDGADDAFPAEFFVFGSFFRVLR